MTAAWLDALAPDITANERILRTLALRFAEAAEELEIDTPMWREARATADTLDHEAAQPNPNPQLVGYARRLLGIPDWVTDWAPPSRARAAVRVHEVPEQRGAGE